MTARNPIASLVATAAFLATVLIVFVSMRKSHRARSEAKPLATASTEEEVLLPARLPANSTDAQEHDLRHAADADTRRMFGRVTTEAGSAVAGAHVSWTALVRLDQIPPMNWQSLDRALIAHSTLSTESDARGQFSFDSTPPGATTLGSVLWVTADGFRAQRTNFDTDAQSWPSGAPITMTRSADLRVRVLDASGAPVRGAQVVQLGLAPAAGSSRNVVEIQAHRLYSREWLTGASGDVLLPAFNGTQCVFASLDGLQSSPWLAREDTQVTEIELRMHPTYGVVGRVTVADAKPFDASSTFVSAYAIVDGTRRRQGQTRINPDFTIGPWNLPIVEARELVFELNGGDLESRAKSIAPPEAGAIIELAFESRVGRTLRVHVIDEARGAIAFATVDALAFVEGSWSVSNAVADVHGIANLRGCVDGSMWLDVKASGFVSRRIDSFLAAPDRTEPYEVVLQRAGVIEGKCVHEETPVHAFNVLHWTSNPREFILASFVDRTDGSFRIENAPVGPVWIMASSKEVVRGEPMRVDVLPDIVNHVDLELPHGFMGHGRVVDARTHAGIAGAQVGLFASIGSQPMLRSPASTTTDADGNFEIGGFPFGSSIYEVVADGYALHRNQTRADEDRFDIGLITLAPRQTLEVTLLGGGASDWTAYQLALEGFDHVDERSFDADGRATVPDLAPGRWHLHVRTSDDHELLIRVDLVSGADWRVDVPINSDRKLKVRIEPKAGEELPPNLALRCTFIRPDGKRVDAYSYAHDEGEFDLGYVVGASANLEVRSQTDETLASLHIRLHPGANDVTLPLDGRSLRVRVVDAAKVPIEGVEVVLSEPLINAAWSTAAISDEEGMAQFGSVVFERVFAAAYHRDHGTRIEVPIDVSSAGDKTLEFVLDARASVRVELRDGETPLPGVFVRLSDSGEEYRAHEGMSDGNARVEAGRLGEGTYQMQVAHPGIWPVVVPVHALREAPDEIVQLRRLGALELVVRNAAGANIVDSEVALRSLEFGIDVGEWLSAGRVSSATQTLRTNGQGVLRVNGLPRGEYRWSIGGVEGVVSVPPLASVVVPIVVP